MRESREKRKVENRERRRKDNLRSRKDQKAPGPDEEVSSESGAKASFYCRKNSELSLREQ